MKMTSKKRNDLSQATSTLAITTMRFLTILLLFICIITIEAKGQRPKSPQEALKRKLLRDQSPKIPIENKYGKIIPM